MAEKVERWADIPDAREQFEAMLGMKIFDWQWDYIQHFSRGEKLVRQGSWGYKWVHAGLCLGVEGCNAVLHSNGCPGPKAATNG